jgi:hypothetical protein
MQITSAYKMMRFAVSDSKNQWRMTILDDPDLVANSDIGSTQPEISTARPKEAAAMVDFTPSAFKDRKAVKKAQRLPFIFIVFSSTGHEQHLRISALKISLQILVAVYKFRDLECIENAMDAV